MSPAFVLTTWDARAVSTAVERLTPSFFGAESEKLSLEAPRGFCLFAVEVTWEQTDCWLSVAEIMADPQRKQG